MKKIILIIFLLLSISCLKEEEQDIKIEEVVLDCKCDRIIEVSSYSIAGTVEISYFAILKTINDCTKWQKQFTVRGIRNINEIPKVGECG